MRTSPKAARAKEATAKATPGRTKAAAEEEEEDKEEAKHRHLNVRASAVARWAT